VCQSNLNGLGMYTLPRADKVDDRTINYWRGLGLPAFLFCVIENGSNGLLHCYHKRYTPLLDGFPGPDDETGSKSFYLVNDGATFLAFADTQREIGGFARDLIIDYARLSYSKGHIVQLTPSQLGFWPFPNKGNPEVILQAAEPAPAGGGAGGAEASEPVTTLESEQAIALAISWFASNGEAAYAADATSCQAVRLGPNWIVTCDGVLQGCAGTPDCYRALSACVLEQPLLVTETCA